MPTDEELLHAFYAGDDVALHRLGDRLGEFLFEIALLILRARGVASAALAEWDLGDRLADVWAAVVPSRAGRRGRWVYEHVSALREREGPREGAA